MDPSTIIAVCALISILAVVFYALLDPLKEKQAHLERRLDKTDEKIDKTDEKIDGLKEGQQAIEAKFEKKFENTDEKLDKILVKQYQDFERESAEKLKKLFNKIKNLRKKACLEFANSLSDERDKIEARDWAESWTILDTSETAHETGIKMTITNIHKRDKEFGNMFFETQDKELASEYKKAFQTPIEEIAKMSFNPF